MQVAVAHGRVGLRDAAVHGRAGKRKEAAYGRVESRWRRPMAVLASGRRLLMAG